jgi:hypothetical protein
MYSSRHGQRSPIGQGIPTPAPPTQLSSLEGFEGGRGDTRDIGNSVDTGNRAIVQADGTFTSTPCALHINDEIR